MALHYRLFKQLVAWIAHLYFRVRVEGVENLPARGPCLLLANHASYLDPPLIGGMIGRECHFLGRAGIAYAPVLGAICRAFNTHAIRRGGIDRDAIERCVAILRAGWTLLLFPEGTRSTDGRIAAPRWGFGMILEQLPTAPCVPVLIQGSERAWGRGMIFPRPRQVSIRYGRPFTFDPQGEGESRRNFYDRCAARLLDEWRALGGVVAAET